MATSYIRCFATYNDPVWGPQALPEIRTPLIRVYRNRLRKAVFEWAGNRKSAVDIAYLRKSFPVVMLEQPDGNPYRYLIKPRLP